jgi:putative oxidoreductase
MRVIMNVALWVVQGLLAVAYLAAGFMKATRPLDTLGTSMPWVKEVPSAFVRFIGIAEVLGAIGLILPLITGVLPWLTVAAAIGLVVVQVSAAIFHASRREMASLPMNLILLVLALAVAYGRLAVVPA